MIQPIMPPKASIASCLGVSRAGPAERPPPLCDQLPFLSSLQAVGCCRLGLGRLCTLYSNDLHLLAAGLFNTAVSFLPSVAINKDRLLLSSLRPLNIEQNQFYRWEM